MEGPSRTDPARLRGRIRHNKTVNFSGVAQPGELVRGRDRVRHQHDARRRGSACCRALPERRRALRPDRGRQDRRGRRARRAPARARGGPGGDLRRRAPGLRGPRDPHRRARRAAEQQRLEHRLVGFVPVDRALLGRRVHAAGPPRDRRRAGRGPPADRGGRHRPLPARGADRALRCRRRRRRSCARGSRPRARAEGAAALHAELAERAPEAAAAVEPTRQRPGWCGRSSCSRWGRSRRAPAASRELWTGETRHPTLLCGLVREREDLYARIDARVDAMVAAGAVEEVRRARRRGRLAHRPGGARLRGAPGGRRRGDEAPHPQLRQAPAHLDAQAAERSC